MLKAFARVIVEAAEPGSAHTARDAVETCGVSGINEGFAGFGHGVSLVLVKASRPRISLSLG